MAKKITKKKTTKKVKENVKKNEDLKLECCGIKEKDCSDGKIEVYVCPRCQSVDVGYHFGLKNLFGVIPKMKCRNCSFISTVFPKWVIDKEKITGKVSKVNSGDKNVNKKIKKVDMKTQIEQEYCSNCEDHIKMKMKDGKVNTFVCENCKFEIKKGRKKK